MQNITRRECNDILAELESWYASPRGRYLLQATREAMQDMLDTAFGYHILQLGLRGEEPLCKGSPINHRIFCAERPGERTGVVAHADELPIESDTIDAVILHHCLEFANSPHRVLREVQRVLTPQGQLLIVGFNPVSLHGLSAQVRGLLRHELWRWHRPVVEHRLTDWLHLLGCDVDEVIRLYGVPPIGKGRLQRALMACDAWTQRHNFPLGGVYVLHATKQVVRPRPLARQRRERLLSLVPKPAPVPPASRNLGMFEKRNADH